MMNWDDTKIQTMIELFSAAEFMWNTSLKDYHNRTKRRVFCQTVARQLGTTGMTGAYL